MSTFTSISDAASNESFLPPGLEPSASQASYSHDLQGTPVYVPVNEDNDDDDSELLRSLNYDSLVEMDAYNQESFDSESHDLNY